MRKAKRKPKPAPLFYNMIVSYQEAARLERRVTWLKGLVPRWNPTKTGWGDRMRVTPLLLAMLVDRQQTVVKHTDDNLPLLPTCAKRKPSAFVYVTPEDFVKIEAKVAKSRTRVYVGFAKELYQWLKIGRNNLDKGYALPYLIFRCLSEVTEFRRIIHGARCMKLSNTLAEIYLPRK